ncbi:MAG: hypothetical protein ACREHG_02195, partial [Candidatus Saccharimonadales bacterium]
MVTFDPNELPEVIEERAATTQTTLTGFFEANRIHPDVASQYTYQEFPQAFVWNRKHQKWTARK